MPGANGEWDLDDPDLYLNRELTWLNFNYRVLNEAADPRTPLLERVKFLAIVGSNLDEFFMKRIGGLKQQVGAGVIEPVRRWSYAAAADRSRVTRRCTTSSIESRRLSRRFGRRCARRDILLADYTRPVARGPRILPRALHREHLPGRHAAGDGSSASVSVRVQPVAEPPRDVAVSG